MPEHDDIGRKIDSIRKSLVAAGYFDGGVFGEAADRPMKQTSAVSKIEAALRDSRKVREELNKISTFLHDKVVEEVLRLDSRIREPQHFEYIRDFLKTILDSAEGFKEEREFVPVYGELLSTYILSLYRCGSPGRESPILKMILTNIARRKAIEIDQTRFQDSVRNLGRTVTIALIARRMALKVLATRGMTVLLRSDIDFQTFGTSPEGLALQLTNILMKNGIRLTEVTDIVCGGGDLGALPDGIYVLTQKVRDESWKRLANSSLNRGPLVAWELRELLKRQGQGKIINASVCSPLSFCTLGPHDMYSLFRQESREIRQLLAGYVKVTPLKSLAALLSEILRLNQENLNLLVMSLDGVFASVVRKTGPRIAREMAAQEANKTLINFDFDRIHECLKTENFEIPATFSLASREIGTGVKEICELLMIVESRKISPSLARSLIQVVNSYARQVAMVLEMASTGKPRERPQYIAIASMMALDPYFQKLFAKIRNRLDDPFTPIMCLDSLEHEYLIANHLFEIYVNPASGDRRLHFSFEARSMKQALQVLGTAVARKEAFSFSSLLEDVKRSIADGSLPRANLVLVGADNEDALKAVSEARDHGLLERVALIGSPDEITDAIQRTRLPLSPNQDSDLEIIPVDPLAVNLEDKKQSMAAKFRDFLAENPDFVVMKGSVDTAKLLHEALSLYKSEDGLQAPDHPTRQRMATCTALFVLPDGRFFALSDPAVNPTFKSTESLLTAIENLADVVRKVVDPKLILKVAIITAVEKETAAIPATLLAAETESRAHELEEQYGPLVVEGPLSFDLATVPEVAEEKSYRGKIMGDANCLVATEINTANVLYKMLSKTMGSLGLMIDNGTIITAGPGTVPMVLTSRGDTAATKFNSILLAMAYSLRGRESRREISLKPTGTG